MRNQELQQLLSEILAKSRTANMRLPRERRVATVESRVPALLKTCYAIDAIGLSDQAMQEGLARLLAARSNPPAAALEAQAHERWQHIEDELAPQTNGHATVWQRVWLVLNGRVGEGGSGRHADAGTGGHGDGGTRGRGDRATRRRAGFAVAAAVAVLATIAFIVSHTGTPSRKQPVVVKRERKPVRKSEPRPSGSGVKQPATSNGSRSSKPSVSGHVEPNRAPALGQTETPNQLSSPSKPGRTTEPPPDEREYARNEHVKVGTFVKVMGAPTITGLGKGERGSRVLKPSDGVYTATRIVTGDADKAELQFNDGTTLALNFNTTLEIPGERGAAGSGSAVSSEQLAVSPTRPLAHSPTRPSEVKLLLGHLWAKVHKAPDQKFSVETPVATAAVRGTEFGLRVQRTGLRTEDSGLSNAPGPNSSLIPRPSSLEAVLTVKEGTVEFSNSLGKVEATTMTETIARPDSKPTEPKRLKVLKIARLTSSSFTMIETSRPKLEEVSSLLVFPAGDAGLSLRDLTPELSGAAGNTSQIRVVRVKRNSPAEKAGLQVGDAVNFLDGKSVNTANQVRAAIIARPNARVSLGVSRGTKQKNFTLITRQPDDAPPMPSLSRSGEKSLRDATWLFLTGKIDEAERALQRLIAESTHSSVSSERAALAAAAHNNLGLLCLLKDGVSEAIQHFERARELDPKVSLYHYNLATTIRNIGNFERSVEELDAAVKLASRWLQARSQLSFGYQLLDRHEDAIKAIDAALSIAPDSPDTWADKAISLRRQNGNDEALQAALKAASIEPAFARAHHVAGSIYHSFKQYKKAEELARRAIEIDPGYATAYNTLGNALHELHNDDEAEKMYRKAIDLDPKLCPSSNLCILYLSRQKFDEAEKVARRMIEIAPEEAFAYARLGGVYLQRLDLDNAEQMYRKAIELSPNSMNGYVLLSMVQGLSGRRKARVETLRQAVALNPDSATGYELMVQFYREDQQFDEAIKMQLKRMEIEPGGALQQYHELATLYDLAGRYDEAEKVWRKAMELHAQIGISPKGLGAIFPLRGLGAIYRQQGQLEKTVEYLLKALELDSTSTGPAGARGTYGALGDAYLALGKLDDAENAYRKLLQLVPKHADAGLLHSIAFRYWAYRGLGDICRRRGQSDEAEQLYLQYADTIPKQGAAERLAIFYRIRGQLDQAEEMCRKALEIDPDFSNGYLWLGHIYRERGQLDEAKKMYEKAAGCWRPKVKEKPDDLTAAAQLGEILAEQGVNLDEALSLLQRAVKAKPSPYSLSRLGWVHYQLGDLTQAEATLKKAIATNYAEAAWQIRTWEKLAHVYEKKGDRPEAMRAYREALKLQADNMEAKAALERLEKEAKGGMPDDK